MAGPCKRLVFTGKNGERGNAERGRVAPGDGLVNFRGNGGKGYMIPYEAGGKRLYQIGASLDTELRTLKEWVVVEAA